MDMSVRGLFFAAIFSGASCFSMQVLQQAAAEKAAIEQDHCFLGTVAECLRGNILLENLSIASYVRVLNFLVKVGMVRHIDVSQGECKPLIDVSLFNRETLAQLCQQADAGTLVATLDVQPMVPKVFLNCAEKDAGGGGTPLKDASGLMVSGRDFYTAVCAPRDDRAFFDLSVTTLVAAARDNTPQQHDAVFPFCQFPLRQAGLFIKLCKLLCVPVDAKSGVIGLDGVTSPLFAQQALHANALAQKGCLSSTLFAQYPDETSIERCSTGHNQVLGLSACGHDLQEGQPVLMQLFGHRGPAQ